MESPKKENKKPDSAMQEVLFGLSFATSFGFSILVPTLLGLWLGLTLDKKFDTKPWLTVIILVLGSVIGFLASIHQIKRYISSANDKSKKL